jgi:predicted HAD superfamily Cof-like phosphohydrolase
MSLNKSWLLVKEFHERFGHPCSDIPRFLPEERSIKRYQWMLEEIDEFTEAEDMYEQADAMIDLIYFALGTMVEMGIRPDKLFTIVHEANMSKIWSDGKCHYGIDGKVIKPDNWVDPKMLIKREIDAMRKLIEYPPIKAEKYFCVPAILETILKKIGFLEIDQIEIGNFLGINVPVGYNDYPKACKNVHFSSKINLFGVVLKNDSLNNFFKSYNIPLIEEYRSINTIAEYDFIDLINDLVNYDCMIICGFNYSSLFSNGEKKIGHASLITSVESYKNEFTILDPGPKDFGFKNVDAEKLYDAIRSMDDGLWIIRHNKT